MNKNTRYSTFEPYTKTEVTTTVKKGSNRIPKTVRCECCGRYVPIEDVTIRIWNELTQRGTNVCNFCNRWYDDVILTKYSYGISRTPVSWLTGSYTMKVGK